MSQLVGNVVNENGEQFIPASQRPDGTWRKARRVKDGYVPQEEVPLYESKGKQFNKKSTPVVLPSGKVAEKSIPGLYIVQNETKKKPAKKISTTEVTNRLRDLNLTEKSRTNESQETKDNNTESMDPVKKMKNLKKKLREIEALQEKIDSGVIPKPELEQLAKIKRKNEILMQIHLLEKQQ